VRAPTLSRPHAGPISRRASAHDAAESATPRANGTMMCTGFVGIPARGPLSLASNLSDEPDRSEADERTQRQPSGGITHLIRVTSSALHLRSSAFPKPFASRTSLSLFANGGNSRSTSDHIMFPPPGSRSPRAQPRAGGARGIRPAGAVLMKVGSRAHAPRIRRRLDLHSVWGSHAHHVGAPHAQHEHRQEEISENAKTRIAAP